MPPLGAGWGQSHPLPPLRHLNLATHLGAPMCWEALCSRAEVCVGGASCRVGALPLPLFPSDPPLASDVPLRQLPCLPKECTGWSEGASRAVVRVCALVCACVATDFIKASCPRAAEARQPPIPCFGSCGKPESPCSLLPRQRGAEHPCHCRCLPGGALTAASGSQGTGGRAPAGC